MSRKGICFCLRFPSSDVFIRHQPPLGRRFFRSLTGLGEVANFLPSQPICSKVLQLFILDWSTRGGPLWFQSSFRTPSSQGISRTLIAIAPSASPLGIASVKPLATQFFMVSSVSLGRCRTVFRPIGLRGFCLPCTSSHGHPDTFLPSHI